MLRPIGPKDPPRLAAIARREGWDEAWGVGEDSFVPYARGSKDGACLVWGEPPVGFAAYRSWGRVGYLGLLLVDAEARRSMIGSRLLTAVQEHAREEGAPTLKVDALFPALPFYRTFGFQEEYLVHRLRHPGIASPRRRLLERWKHALAPPRPEPPPDLGELEERDRRAYPWGRGPFLRSLAASCHTLLAGSASCLSYVVRPSGVHVVSAVSEPGDAEAVQAAVHGILAKWSGRPAFVSVPEPNRDALDLWRRCGFTGMPGERRAHLFLGEPAPEEPERVYSL